MPDPVYALVEGHLDGRLLKVAWRQLGHDRSLIVRDAGGNANFWIEARRYNKAATQLSFIGLVDQESDACPVAALARLNRPVSPQFRLRVAVRMIESWIVADRVAFAAFLGVPVGKLPMNPDTEPHPKRLVVALAATSRRREIRQTLLPTGSSATVGAEYTPTMAAFIETNWNGEPAREHSPSLDRALSCWSGF